VSYDTSRLQKFGGRKCQFDNFAAVIEDTCVQNLYRSAIGWRDDDRGDPARLACVCRCEDRLAVAELPRRVKHSLMRASGENGSVISPCATV
jgi:hypothetical protein